MVTRLELSNATAMSALFRESASFAWRSNTRAVCPCEVGHSD